MVPAVQEPMDPDTDREADFELVDIKSPRQVLIMDGVVIQRYISES